VEATVPVSRLRWLSFPDGSGEREGSAVEIRDRNAWPPGVHRSGRLDKLVAELDGTTRMARVLIAVQDPMALHTDAPDIPRLMVGAYVESRIEGRPIPDVVRVARELVRKDDTIWLMRDGVLRIQDLDVAAQDSRYAYVRAGLSETDAIVVTNLSTVEDGAPLRTESIEDAAAEAP